MSVFQIVFSPTGGTKKVSELFTKTFCTESIYIDLCCRTSDFSAYSFHSEDICIISVPSYGGRVPDTAAVRLRQMRGNKAQAVLITVYGNRAYEDTLAELKDTLTDAGFSCTAAVAAVAEHSIMRRFAAGRPDAQDAQELAAFAETIRSRLQSGKIPAELDLPGSQPYREYGGVPMKPQAGKACTRCGLCAEQCPAGAIHISNPAKTDARLCISCMRCIAVCPSRARKVSRILLAAGSLKLKNACSKRKSNELFL